MHEEELELAFMSLAFISSPIALERVFLDIVTSRPGGWPSVLAARCNLVKKQGELPVREVPVVKRSALEIEHLSCMIQHVSYVACQEHGLPSWSAGRGSTLCKPA